MCRLDLCGYYDPEGKSEAAVFKGHESCGLCGCSLKAKTACMSCACALKDEGRQPIWDNES